jgi:hypothetical protein
LKILDSGACPGLRSGIHRNDDFTGFRRNSKVSFTPRCIKDVIEEELFHVNSDLFTGVDLFFFDTTSIYFEGLPLYLVGKIPVTVITASAKVAP